MICCIYIENWAQIANVKKAWTIEVREDIRKKLKTNKEKWSTSIQIMN